MNVEPRLRQAAGQRGQEPRPCVGERDEGGRRGVHGVFPSRKPWVKAAS